MQLQPLEAPTHSATSEPSHNPCNQPRQQPRVTRCTQQPTATTHGVNGGDEHGVNDNNANGEDDPNPHAEPRLILTQAGNIVIHWWKEIQTPFLQENSTKCSRRVEGIYDYQKNETTYSTSGSGNMANIRDFEFGEPIGCGGSEEDEFADSCNAAASAKTKCETKKGPMDKFCKNPENAISRRKMEMLRQMNIRESMDKNEVLKVHQHIAHFWYQAGEKLFELLDAIVEEVGEENVVQVVTDNGSNYVLAGKLLEEKRKHIYWTPCAAHCIDLMLEDIGKLPLIRKTIRRAINLVGFIYAHSNTLSLSRNFTNKRELVRHAITRLATSYLTLERLHKEKANIRKMFTSDEWTLNKLSKEPKGKEAAKVVLMPSFWNSVVYILKVMAPLVKVLRLVDGEKKPAMGYIYEAMDKAKETIIMFFNSNESKYKDVFAIIDKRWNCQLHKPLHAAAHFLNPEFFYDNTDLEFDFEVTNGLFECI
ncbi:hypothetical protein HKD37_07G019464 [Glycine soja]